MTAEERAKELYHLTLDKLPFLAQKFVDYWYIKYDLCCETRLACLAVYAQCVEGLKCADSCMQASLEDRVWFEDNKPVEDDF